MPNKLPFDIRQLQIGNVVKCRISNDAGYYHVLGVDSIGDKVAIDRCGLEIIPSHKIAPVRINLDVIKRCQFQEDNDSIWYIDAFPPGFPAARFTINWTEKDGIVLVSRYQSFNMDLKQQHIKYLHQVQNLYKILTHEEMEFDISHLCSVKKQA